MQERVESSGCGYCLVGLERRRRPGMPQVRVIRSARAWEVDKSTWSGHNSPNHEKSQER